MTKLPTKPIKALLGTKVGMTQVWNEEGQVIPVTVVRVDTNVVTQIRNAETDGYSAVQIATGAIDPRKVTQPLKGHYEKAGVTPRRHVAEIRTSDAEDYTLGQELDASIFESGQIVDVVGTSKGKGTAGVMKRHGFGGAGASHGQHRNHRKGGSIGGAATPGRVFKGMKMAGRMGFERVTVQNLKVQSVDVDSGLIAIAGAIPGPKGGLVMVHSPSKSKEA